MIDASEKHPGRDHDLTERYVLNRLTPGERSWFDAHLKNCAPCRLAIETEREIAAGVRLTGRGELKSRLRQRVAEPVSVRIPWVTIVSVAAVVAIVMLVGVSNNWFASRDERPLMSSGTVQESAQSPPPAATPDIPSQPLPPGSSGGALGDAAKPERRDRKDTRVLEDKETDVTPPARKDLPAPVAVAETNGMEKLGIATIAESRGMWVEGFIIDGEIPESRVSPEESEKNKLGSMDAVGRRGARLMLSKGTIAPPVTLSQEPFRALSIEQQSTQQQQRFRSITTRVEQTAHGIHLTLYPESPIDSSALAQARIESITDDSLVVSLSGQRINYRLPNGWQSTRK